MAPATRLAPTQDLARAERDRLVRLRRLGYLLDDSIPIPGTRFRVGLEAIIGLVPGIGDLVGGGFSLYILLQAARIGVPASLLARMGWNLLADVVVGSVPFLGDLFDAGFKANLRNLALLDEHLREPGAVAPRQPSLRRRAGDSARCWCWSARSPWPSSWFSSPSADRSCERASSPSLHSVAIFVSDLPRAVEFYRDSLRLPMAQQGSFGAEFLDGPTHIGVHPAVHADAKKLVGRHTGITLFVTDLLHYCGDLHARGVRFVTEPTQQPWGIMAMVADPDGNILALWEDRTPDGRRGIGQPGRRHS